MTVERIAGICFSIVITSGVATGQQRSETTDQGPQRPARSVIEGTYAAGQRAPWRRVHTRSVSGGREVVVETSELPDVDGRLAPIQEIVTETIRTAPNTAQTKREVFGFATDRRRRLVETSESLHETLANEDSAVHNTWVPNLNGRLGLTSRQIEQTRRTTPDVRQTDTTRLVPRFNDGLRNTERTEYTERQINPGVVGRESTHLVRDVNGRWKPVETRRGEAREIGASERTEDETIQRRDINGNLALDKRIITRRFQANEQDDVVIETYRASAFGLPRADSRLALSERVHRTTRATAGGGRYTVEEVEGRSRVAPNDPMRVIRRTVTTVRQIGTERWVIERQVFKRDVNGRLLLVINETEETTGE
jgi:hypothetical protein